MTLTKKPILYLFLFLIHFFSFFTFADDSRYGKYLVLNNPSDSGMFAVFSSVLGALNLYEHGGFAGLKIDLNSGRYLDPSRGPNWWEYFFEPIELGDPSYEHHHFTLQEYMPELTSFYYPSSRHHAYALIKKYIRLKPEIRIEIEDFVNRHFKGHYVIGIHHRGTDKKEEWPIIAYERTYQAFLQVLHRLPRHLKMDFKIFIATDEQKFLDFMRERWSDHLIYNDFARSSDETALHAYGANFYENNYQMGKEALLDCILLSRANILIRPAGSCLSNMSTNFNPDLPVVNLAH